MRELRVGKIGGRGMNMLVDYIPAKECKCGRKFDEFGIMIDDGGTSSMNEEDLV